MGVHEARRGRPLRLRAINPAKQHESLQLTVPAWVVRDLKWEHGDYLTYVNVDREARTATLRLATTDEVMAK